MLQRGERKNSSPRMVMHVVVHGKSRRCNRTKTGGVQSIAHSAQFFRFLAGWCFQAVPSWYAASKEFDTFSVLGNNVTRKAVPL